MSRPGKNTAIKAYPGRNSNNTSANGILSGIWSKGGIRIKTKAKNVVIRTKYRSIQEDRNNLFIIIYFPAMKYYLYLI
jgi:hypothetical protein